MKRKRASLFLIALILSSAIAPLSLIGAQGEWEIVERGPSFIRRQQVGTDTYSWESALQWVYNGSEYVPYIYVDNYAAGGFYQVQSGLIGARLYDYYSVFYNPNMTEIVLYDERWEVERWIGPRPDPEKEWTEIGAQSGTPTWAISESETGVNITKSFTSWAGELTIIYIFREGAPLKHTVYFNSSIADSTQFRVVQEWAGIVAAKVKHDKGETVITSATTVDGSGFRFLNDDGGLSIFENQWQMYYGRNETTGEYYVLANENLKPVEINIHAQGLKADFVFGNWSLSQGEQLEIDPSTSSMDDSTKHGWIRYTYSEIDGWHYHYYYDSDELNMDSYHWFYRNFIEWDISGIPDGRDITNVIFKYHGQPFEADADSHVTAMTSTKPSASSAGSIYNAIAAGTIYINPSGFPAAGTNRQVDLGTVADADLEAKLTANWFAIGLRDDDEAYDHYMQHGGIWSELYGEATPKPTLYVEYQAYPTVTSGAITDMDDTNNVQAMNGYYSFEGVVNDLEGSTSIDKVYLRGLNGAGVLFEVRATSLTGTPAYAIESGAGIIDLDAGSSSWAENGNEGTLTFKIRTEGDFPQYEALELAVYVEDSVGASSGWVTVQTDYWDTINRLVTTGFAASDGRINIGGSGTLSGTLKYATTMDGDTASSISPPDNQVAAVHFHDSGHTSRGNDPTLVSGAFSNSFNIPGTVQNNPYHVHLDMVGDWSDGDAPDADTASIIGDRGQPQSYSASDSRVILNDNVNIDVTLWYDYDNTLVVDGVVTIDGYSAAHQGSGVWRITRTNSSVNSVLYDVVALSGNAYGISAIDQNGKSQLVIWDRFNVTGLWASNLNPITGETVFLYATGELAFDGHMPDSEDDLNISGIGFEWDWAEEWFYAEVNKSTPGAITYDTLTSIDEYSYGITVGTMDGNTVTVTWGSYEVHFLGLFNENGTSAGSVNVTAHLPSGANIFTVDGSEDKGFSETPEMFSFPLAGGGCRYLYSFENNETLYLFTPDDTYSVYSFTIRDYTGQVGRAETYLESLRIVNGTERMVERQIIWDTANSVPLTLVQSQIYALQVRFEDNSTYRFGYFIPGAEATPTLSIYEIDFSAQAHIPAEHILVEGLRPDDEHIRVNYKDYLDDTDEVFVEVCLLNGTQAWNDTGVGDILQFNWYGADNETDYMVQVNITHGFYGDLTYTCWLEGGHDPYEDPPNLGVFGDWPIQGALASFLIIATACLFSRGSAVIGMGVTVLVAAVLTGINWIAIPYTVLATAFSLVVMWGLSGGGK